MNNIRLELGASSYFSQPADTLDPHLFEDSEHIRPYVRKTILDSLFYYLGAKYNNPELWTMAWLAGSGISYQWAASRGNGDLDVLLGIDYSEFVNNNPESQWMDRHEIADAFTEDLRRNLWPRTSHVGLGYETDNGWWIEQTYEITYFLNDQVEATSNSITNIHPYAAYNLTKDEWTIKPPGLPSDPHSLYPEEYYNQADANKEAAHALVTRYNSVRAEGSTIVSGTPQEVNNKRHRALVQAEARTLFDSLHLGRKHAFSNIGEGYGDFYNFQWQSAKESGIVNALNEIINQEN
jgi:hypothetical protein